MSNLALDVHNLSKRFRIGYLETQKDTLMGTLTSWVKSPLENYRTLKKLSSFGTNEDSEDIIWALKDVSFQVKTGEVLGVIGHNGAGKSTLLKLLSRITEPTSGYADINGRVSSLLEVGTGFHKELTGRENVYLNGTILGMTKGEIDKKFDAIVDFSGVEKFIDTPVKRYSSGMKVRLAFSVAAHLEPEVLLIDEVLAVGDAEFQKKCLGKMDDIAGEGRTVLFVSHNMIAVQSLCKRVVWMDHGKIREDGETTAIISRYLRTADDSSSVIVWEDMETAPGNDQVKIKQVQVEAPDCNDGMITMNMDVFLHFDYWNLRQEAILHVTVKLLNEQGIIVFTTNCAPAKLPEGLYRSTVRIPGNLLNSGVYYVNVLMVENGGSLLYKHERIIAFELIEPARDTGYMGREEGVFRPSLDWDTKALEADSIIVAE